MRGKARTLQALVVVAIGAAIAVAGGVVPPESVDRYGQQTGVKFPAGQHVEIGQAVQVTVIDAPKLTLKIISMDRNFTCEQGDRIQVKFTGLTSVMMLLSDINKVAVFTFKDDKWQLDRLEKASAWQQQQGASAG